jgi:translation initiation factor 2B subunit (eIF-2B alpha/beta/delta family)
MDAPYRPDALVAPLRADVVSGAAVVGRMAAEVLRRGVARIPATDRDELREGLVSLGCAVLDAQPSMAPLVRLVSDVLEAVRETGSVEEAREAAARAAHDFREGQETRTRVVARRGAGLLPEGGRVLTLSSSSTVRATLLHRASTHDVHVVCLEGRPVKEGAMLAETLAGEKVRVTLAVDAAAASLAPLCDVVLLGADSVGDAGLVNKIGSRSVADAARRAGVPVYVVTDETKILPPGFPQPVDDDRPAEEVGRTHPGVRVWNRYFECLPVTEVTAVVTERETLEPEKVEEYRAGLRVPEELRAWARERSGGGEAL